MISKLDSRDGGGGEKRRFFPQPLCTWLYLKLVKRKELRGTELAYGLIENKFKWCIGKSKLQHPHPPSPPWAYLGHLTPLPSRGGRNLIIRVFQGVGNLIPMCYGWGIWTAPLISCEIASVMSYHRGRGVRGFSWKRLCLCGQLVTRKGLNKLCAIFEGI